MNFVKTLSVCFLFFILLSNLVASNTNKTNETCFVSGKPSISAKDSFNNAQNYIAQGNSSYEIDKKVQSYTNSVNCLQNVIKLNKNYHKDEVYFLLVALYEKLTELTKEDKDKMLYYASKAIFYGENSPAILHNNSADFNKALANAYMFYTSYNQGVSNFIALVVPYSFVVAPFYHSVELGSFMQSNDYFTALKPNIASNTQLKENYLKIIKYLVKSTDFECCDENVYLNLASYSFLLSTIENDLNSKQKYINVSKGAIRELMQTQQSAPKDDNIIISIIYVKVLLEEYKMAEYKSYLSNKSVTKSERKRIYKQITKILKLIQEGDEKYSKTLVDYFLVEVNLRHLRFKQALKILQANSEMFIEESDRRIWLELVKADSNIKREQKLTKIIKNIQPIQYENN